MAYTSVLWARSNEVEMENNFRQWSVAMGLDPSLVQIKN